jgi:4-diphosphocytidyl-2-C-methyl-D-erythritol kinase
MSVTQTPRVIELARAKVNLTLEVLGKRPDGYHELRSIVAFADFGDMLTFTPGGAFSLTASGPMAASIDGPNLIEKAAALVHEMLAEQGEADSGRFDLIKRIPVAAGLGGGSADAAAAIRAMLRANAHIRLDERKVERAALSVGADVPVCLRQSASVMGGVGDVVRPLEREVAFPAVLVNPGVKLSTREVFAALDAPPSPPTHASAREGVAHIAAELEAGDWMSALLASRNDLEPAARRLEPLVQFVLTALRECAGCRFARLSGSGPTCFAIFNTAENAAAAAAALQAEFEEWWIVATRLS